MSHLPQSVDEQGIQEETLRLVNSLVSALEKRIAALLQANEPQSMKPGEREQATSRHLAMLLRLLQYRQKLAQSPQDTSAPAGQALLDALLRDAGDL
jgi:hypothetical protein